MFISIFTVLHIYTYKLKIIHLYCLFYFYTVFHAHICVIAILGGQTTTTNSYTYEQEIALLGH